MKIIDVKQVTEAVKYLCIKSNYDLPKDVEEKIQVAYETEKWKTARDILDKVLENIAISRDERLPMCQDTGMVCVYIDIGQDVHIVGGLLEDAINRGISQGYEEAYLRKSVVRDPLIRENTGDNTPAVINYRIISGEKLKITVAPKGFGSENMSQLRMLKPSDGIEGVKDFVIRVVTEADSNPCPPIVVGVGIGGTFDKVAQLSKKALLRPLNEPNPNSFYAELEDELLERINRLGIGPQGFGGKTTALKVNIETFPTHIAGLPVAVNINCHVTRHSTIDL